MAIADTIKSRTRGRKASQEDVVEVIDLPEDKDEKGRKSPDRDDIEVVNPKSEKRRKGSPKKETSETVESKSSKTSKNNEKSKDDSSWGDLPLTVSEDSPLKKPTPASKGKESAPATKSKESASTTKGKDSSSTLANNDTDKSTTNDIVEVKYSEKKSRKRDREENREKPFVPKENSSKDEWNCLMCFLPNLMEDIACIRCLTNRPGAKKSYRWTCLNCSTSNPKIVTICRLCNSDSSSSSGNESSD